MEIEQLRYWFHDNQLIHISEVPSGLKCNCKCPHCGSPLVARKGKQREHYFAHHGPSSCKHAIETALHLVAKQALEKSSVIKLPGVRVSFNSYREGISIADESTYQIDSIRSEKRVGNIVSDLIATIQQRELFIEIFVTHRVDDQKRNQIRQLGISAIEIDLSNAPRDLDFDSISELVVNGLKNKSWIYNVRAEKEYKKLISQATRKHSITRGLASHVDLCPINARVWRGRPYANVSDDHQICKLCLNEEFDMRVLDCNGHFKRSASTQEQ